MAMAARPPPLAHAILVFLLPALCLSHPALPHTQRSTLCPVILPQDPPSGPDLLPPSLSNRAVEQPPSDADGGNVVTPRIINGDLASTSLQSSLVSLLIRKPDASFTCTGTLISPRWVLTAAHCEVDGNTVVSIGGARRIDLDLSADLISVSDFFIHPDYNDNTAVEMQSDIAVVRLSRPAPTGTPIMQVNADMELPMPGSFVRAVGYGASLNDRAREPLEVVGFLRQVDVPVTSERTCNRAYRNNIDYGLQVCAGYQRGGCDSCQGDSGGPLIQYDALNNPVIVGVTSFGADCAAPLFPGVYARPGAHMAWLDSVGAEYTISNRSTQVTASDVVLSIENAGGAQSEGGLSVGVIAGIAAGGAALVAVVVAVIALQVCRRRKNEPSGGGGGGGGAGAGAGAGAGGGATGVGAYPATSGAAHPPPTAPPPPPPQVYVPPVYAPQVYPQGAGGNGGTAPGYGGTV